MVLKCLNHIYRLSTDVMFFTWSPFVWMKINWWQMRKDSAKRVEDIYWIAAPPSGYLGQLKKKKPQSQCGKAHTPRELSGGLILHGDKWNKMISWKLSGIAPEEEVTGTYCERGSLGSPLQFFLTDMRDGASRHFQYITVLIIIIIINIIIIIIKWRRLLWYLTYMRSNTGLCVLEWRQG